MVAARTQFRSNQLTALVRNIVRLHGGEPAAFLATQTHDGSVCGQGPGTAAFYQREAWTTKFHKTPAARLLTPVTAIAPAATIGSSDAPRAGYE